MKKKNNLKKSHKNNSKSKNKMENRNYLHRICNEKIEKQMKKFFPKRNCKTNKISKKKKMKISNRIKRV